MIHVETSALCTEPVKTMHSYLMLLSCVVVLLKDEVREVFRGKQVLGCAFWLLRTGHGATGVESNEKI